MKWVINKNKAICPQIYIIVCSLIANGSLKPNQRLFSVRKMSNKLQVNPNTIQKAFGQLAEKGVLYSIKNNGWFVTDNINLAKQILEEHIKDITQNFIFEMSSLGLTKSEILEMIRKFMT